MTNDEHKKTSNYSEEQEKLRKEDALLDGPTKEQPPQADKVTEKKVANEDENDKNEIDFESLK